MKKKMVQTAKKLWALVLAALLLLSLTGCGEGPVNVNMSFPDPTAEQVAAVNEARQTSMLLAESTWTLGTKKYIYDNDNRLLRIEVYDHHGLAYHTEYKYTERIGLGTEVTEISYCEDGTLYDRQCRIITLNEQGQCVKVVTTTVDAPPPSTDREPTGDVFEYDDQGRLIRWTDGGEEYRYTYDENGHVVEEKHHYPGTGMEDTRTAYTLDAAGQLILAEQLRDGQKVPLNAQGYAVEYKSDGDGRLVEINRYKEEAAQVFAKTVYTYDDSGKLIGRIDSKGPAFPIPGLEWLNLDHAWGAGAQLTWMTPEAYRAQIKK